MYYLVKVKPQARKQIISALNKRIAREDEDIASLNLSEVLFKNNPELLYLRCESYEVATRLTSNLSYVYGILSKDPLDEASVASYSVLPAPIAKSFNIGDMLTVQGGPFQSLIFQVLEIQADEILGELNIFGSTRLVTIPKSLLQEQV